MPSRNAVGFSRKNGAGGENRTRDLPLTKGLRYHYATPASNRSNSEESGGKRAAITEEGEERKVSELDKSGPQKTTKTVREAKLEAALKENLRRRKAQARARKANAQPIGIEAAVKGSLSSPDTVQDAD